MPKTVLEILEEGYKALLIDAHELPSCIEDADVSNALAACKLIDEQLASIPERKAARLHAYVCVIARLKEEAAKRVPPEVAATDTPSSSNKK